MPCAVGQRRRGSLSRLELLFNGIRSGLMACRVDDNLQVLPPGRSVKIN